jgi:UDPglucose--hexose-1-phosphate uridylyltransferase
MPEFRKDPVLERWIIIAAERAKRPQSRLTPVQATQTGACPFCPGNESMTPPAVLVLANDEPPHREASWSVRVVPNKYPALVSQGDSLSLFDGLYRSMNGAGVHEVIIESPSHVIEMSALGEADIERVLRAYRQRILDLRTGSRWRYALIYKNQGAEAGATLAHSHSQITALPMVPKEPREEIEAARKFFASTGRCVYCDIVRRESEIGERIVMENDRFIAYCPFASRVACETWIVPKRHSSCFESGSREDLIDLARALRETLIRLGARFDQPPFNYFLHNNPLSEPQNDFYHWHLEILPKLHHVAGFEWGSGCYMNPLAPENAARQLREIAL